MECTVTSARLVATAWTSAGDTSPMLTPSTSPVPIAERIAAVADAGYVGMGLVADDLVAIGDAVGFPTLRAMIADAGLDHVEIELLEKWWIPSGGAGNSYDVRRVLFDAADVLEPAFIKIGSELGARTADISPLIGPLHELARQAAEHGTRIAIETMPFSIISTVPMGAEIVSAADHPALGLLVDAWHVFRAGTSLSELEATLPGEYIFGVELDDAAFDVVGTLFVDTVENRLLCGDGDFDLVGLIALLRHKGFDGPWGVEILSTSFRELPVGDALKLAAETTREVLVS